MKSSDRAVLVGLGVVALIAVFWFMVLSPKRAEVSTLDGDIGELQTQVSEQEQLAATAESAKQGYEGNYHRLVVLGKAVPAGEDTASLFVELQEIADHAGVSLDSITLSQAAGGAPAPAPAPAPAATPESSTPDSTSTESTPTATTAAPATEASAADLPLGATVGPAGLPVMPYDLALRGDFFQLADFFHGVDKLVGSKHGRQIVDGRLVTIDGFQLTGDQDKGFPQLSATMAITTFVAPADQGLTAGATSEAPATGTVATGTTTETPPPTTATTSSAR